MVFQKLCFRRMTPVFLIALGTLLTARPVYFYSKGILAQVLLKRAWRSTLNLGESQLAWGWADSHPVGRLRIPSINLDAVVLSDTHNEALAFGPGHWRESCLPGESGLIAVAGHRDSFFRHLSKIKLGDSIDLESSKGNQVFIARRFMITEPDKYRFLFQISDTQIALITCYPFEYTGPAPLRYIVFGELIK